MNLMSKENRKADYVMNGHWSEKARNEARMFSDEVSETWTDETDLYFSVPDPAKWKFTEGANYVHYTAADTRQGFEFQRFPYHAMPVWWRTRLFFESFCLKIGDARTVFSLLPRNC